MLRQLRRALIVSCALAFIPLAFRVEDVAAQLRRDRDAATAFAQASAALNRNQYEAAAAKFTRVIALRPYAAEGYGGLAEAELRRGDFDAAIAAYRALLAIYPYTYIASLYREVALIELRGGRPSDARRDLEQAVMLDPGDWMAFYLLGHAHRRLADRNAARMAWRHVIALQPGYEPAHEQLRSLSQ